MVAGEASGDLHGGNLASEITARAPGCDIFGIAGERMRTAGVRALVNAEDIAGFGVTELSLTIRRTLSAMRLLRATLRRDRPDLAILIDYAEFNMMLARYARRIGIPVLYYIVPQVWAWRRGRIAKLIQRADRLAVVFPFEAQVYAAAGQRVTFVGHPLLDLARPGADRETTLRRHGFASSDKILALLPGSRRSEIQHLLRPFCEAARILNRTRGLVPCILRAPTLTEADLRTAAGGTLDGIRILDGDSYNIVSASELALVASGTATLETALLGCPMVIAYKVSGLTYSIARMLVKGVRFFGMPNILAGRRVVPELIQQEVIAENLVSAAEPMLLEPCRRETIAALKNLRSQLGLPGAAGRVAEIALGMIS